MKEIHGKVIMGKGKGRTLGFPTANLSIECAPDFDRGVYAAKVALSGEWYAAIANIGSHPTLPEGSPTIEVHILDKDLDLYGKKLHIILGQFIRPERRFCTVDALRAQVLADIETVRNMWEE